MLIKFEALPGLAWARIKPSTMKVDGRLEVFDVTVAANPVFALLNLAVESFTHRIGHRMLEVGQDILDMPRNRLGRLAHGGQPKTRGP